MCKLYSGKGVINRDYYMGFSLSPDLSARDSNIGPRACPRSDIGRGLIDRVMTKIPCYDLFIIWILLRKDLQKAVCQYFLIVVVVLLFYAHGKHLRSCRDGQLT